MRFRMQQHSPGLPDGLGIFYTKNVNLWHFLESIGMENFGIFHCHLVCFGIVMSIGYDCELFCYILSPFWSVSARQIWHPWYT
jgi:hypothetical protein